MFFRQVNYFTQIVLNFDGILLEFRDVFSENGQIMIALAAIVHLRVFHFCMFPDIFLSSQKIMEIMCRNVCHI